MSASQLVSLAEGTGRYPAADCIRTAELTALEYQSEASTTTDEKFFGSWSQFEKGVLKESRS